MQFDEAVIEKLDKTVPLAERVFYCPEKGCWSCRFILCIEPGLKLFHDRLRQALPQCKTLFFWERERKAVDMKEAFDQTECVICLCLLGMLRILKVAVHVSPAARRDGLFSILVLDFEEVIQLVGSIGEDDAKKASEKLLHGITAAGFCKFVDVVWVLIVTTEVPDRAGLGLSETLQDEWHAGFVIENDATFHCLFAHEVPQQLKLLSTLLEPPREDRALERNSQIMKNLLLPVKGQMVRHFRCNDVSKEPRAWIPFIDRLVGLEGGNHLAITVAAGVFILHMPDPFEPGWDAFELGRDSETGRLASDFAAWAKEVVASKFVFLGLLFLGGIGRLSAAACVFVFRFFDDASTYFFFLDCLLSPVVELFTGASEVIGGCLGRARAKLIPIASTLLVAGVFEVVHHVADEGMAFFDCGGKFVREDELRLGMWFGAVFGQCLFLCVWYCYIIQ